MQCFETEAKAINMFSSEFSSRESSTPPLLGLGRMEFPEGKCLWFSSSPEKLGVEVARGEASKNALDVSSGAWEETWIEGGENAAELVPFAAAAEEEEEEDEEGEEFCNSLEFEETAGACCLFVGEGDVWAIFSEEVFSRDVWVWLFSSFRGEIFGAPSELPPP